MKFLINAQRKALRKGEYVVADEESGEWILDTDTVEGAKEVTVAMLKGICEANGIHSAKGASRTDMIANLTTNLPNLDIPEQNTMTQTAIIKEIVAHAGANRKPGSDADVFEVDVFTQCIERLNKDGITFKIKQLGKLVQQEIAEQGLIMSNTQRKRAVYEICDKAKFRPTEWEQMEKMLERVTKEVADTDHARAYSLVKRYLKDNEIAMPKRKKADKLSYRQRVIAFMIENSPVSTEALTAFALKNKKDAASVERLESLRETIDTAFQAGVKSVTEEVEEEETEEEAA